jgi:hypothetical protein
MTAKTPKPKEYKLDVFETIRQLDRKNRSYYEDLEPDQQKEISPLVLMRWVSGLKDQGNPDEIEYRILMLNETVNKDMFNISDKNHKQLKWLLGTVVSHNSKGSFRYEYIKHTREKTDPHERRTINFLKSVYPTYKESEIELLARINSRKDIKDLARQHGWTDAEIKAKL